MNDVNKIDWELKMYMILLNLKEEKIKEYSFETCSQDIAYIFDTYDEFKEYFLNNGFLSIDNELLNLCTVKTTKKGKIIALKNLCDNAIKKYKINKELTQEQTDEIHSRGKITPREKVEEWEELEVCIPDIMNGTTDKRCLYFSNCHECLLELANTLTEFDKTKTEIESKEDVYPSSLRKK